MTDIENMKLGFIVNPIAGIGGPAGFPGSDGLLLESIARGGYPLSPRSAYRFVKKLAELLREENYANISLKAAPVFMGCTYVRKLESLGVRITCISDRIRFPTVRDHTIKYTSILAGEVDLLIFVGGDGTARDILEAVGDTDIPVLGVPAGVKMHSGVFAVTPEAAAVVVFNYIRGYTRTILAPVLEYVDGERRYYGELYVPYDDLYLQPAKSPVCSDDLYGIARQLEEIISDDTLFLFGSGRTIYRILQLLGLKGSLWGVDAIVGKKVVGVDLSEKEILYLLSRHRRVRLVVTPIGGQGFILGRGSRAITPRVLRRIERDDLIVVSPHCKVIYLPVLRVDTGDRSVDDKFRGYIRVVVGYGEEVVKKVV